MNLIRPRFDAAKVVRDGLRADARVDDPVELAVDATYDGGHVVTVVQASQRPAPGTLPGNRWLFAADVTLMTFGPDVDVAFAAAYDVADAMLTLTDVEGVRLSSTACTTEPVSQGSQSPTGAATVVSTYTTYLRKEV